MAAEPRVPDTGGIRVYGTGTRQELVSREATTAGPVEGRGRTGTIKTFRR